MHLNWKLLLPGHLLIIVCCPLYYIPSFPMASVEENSSLFGYPSCPHRYLFLVLPTSPLTFPLFLPSSLQNTLRIKTAIVSGIHLIKISTFASTPFLLMSLPSPQPILPQILHLNLLPSPFLLMTFPILMRKYGN